MAPSARRPAADPVWPTEALIAEDIGAWLDRHQYDDTLRFISWETVDDAASALIGRPRNVLKMIFED